VTDENEAAKYYRLSADQGNSQGQFRYGRCLEHGIGVAKDSAEAAKYYKLSANQGNSHGQVSYGRCLEFGTGVQKNIAVAARYYGLATEQGSSSGQYSFGRCHEHGIGVEENLSVAVAYYKSSADQGNSDGQFGFGHCLLLGTGVEKDYGEAARYFRLSADQGNPQGQFSYGSVSSLELASRRIPRRPRSITNWPIPKGTKRRIRHISAVQLDTVNPLLSHVDLLLFTKSFRRNRLVVEIIARITYFARDVECILGVLSTATLNFHPHRSPKNNV
jgi:TPR repeat protein